MLALHDSFGLLNVVRSAPLEEMRILFVVTLLDGTRCTHFLLEANNLTEHQSVPFLQYIKENYIKIILKKTVNIVNTVNISIKYHLR